MKKELMLRLILAGILGVVGIVLAGISIANGYPVIALALLLAAIYVFLGVLLGVMESMENPFFQIGAALIGLVGIIGVFVHNRAFDINIQAAHRHALEAFATMDLHCRPISKELRKIQEFGLKACAIQDNSDQMSVVVDLAKGLYLNPPLTLADSAISLQKGMLPDYCAQVFKTALNICPSAFILLSNADREALIEAVK